MELQKDFTLDKLARIDSPAPKKHLFLVNIRDIHSAMSIKSFLSQSNDRNITITNNSR